MSNFDDEFSQLTKTIKESADELVALSDSRPEEMVTIRVHRVAKESKTFTNLAVGVTCRDICRKLGWSNGEELTFSLSDTVGGESNRIMVDQPIEAGVWSLKVSVNISGGN